MADKHLQAYLADHLAGSATAIDLLAQLESSYGDNEMASGFTKLRVDIEADREELRALMNKLGIEESGTRKTTAWLTAKLGEIKLRVEDRRNGPLRLLESLEAVALGIDGKLALWRSLQTVAEVAPALQRVDYPRLARRAEEQRRRAEQMRLTAARLALGRADQNRRTG